MWVIDQDGNYKWQANTPAEELAIFQQVFINSLGNNANLSPSSINGLFIQELTNFGVQNQNTLSLILSQIYNPNYASGQYLDCIATFNGLQRQPATYSTATCNLAGLAYITVPANTQIISVYGDIFYAQNDIVFDSNGVGVGIFIALQSGAINCDAGALNRILQPVSGWDSVDNLTNGIVGTPVQSDTSFRFERKYNLGVQGTGSVIAMNSALGNTENVIDFIVINNDTPVPLIKRGVTVPVGNIYISVFAPAVNNSVIGLVLANKNSSGTPFYTTGTNTQTNTYVDSKYAFTILTTWDVPNECPIQIDISYLDNPALPIDIQTEIKNIIVNNFNNGTANFPAVNMRQAFYVDQLTVGLADIGVIVLAQTMQTVTSGSPTQSLFLNVVGSIGTTGKPTLDASNINLTPVVI